MNQKHSLQIVKIDNQHEVESSQFLLISNSSFIQAIDSNFNGCQDHGILATSQSFINILHCTFSQFKRNLCRISDQSKSIIHNCEFTNSNSEKTLFYSIQSKFSFYDCSFHSIYWNSITVSENSQLFVEECIFEKSKKPSIAVQNTSSSEIKNSKFLKSPESGLLVTNSSKSIVQNSIFEKCLVGISSEVNSKVEASCCSFNQMRRFSISSSFSSIVNLDKCKIIESCYSLFHIWEDGNLKITGSELKQSKNSHPFSFIESKGKFSMIKVAIDWDDVFENSKDFQNASFVQYQGVILNNILLNDFLLNKQ